MLVNPHHHPNDMDAVGVRDEITNNIFGFSRQLTQFYAQNALAFFSALLFMRICPYTFFVCLLRMCVYVSVSVLFHFNGSSH